MNIGIGDRIEYTKHGTDFSYVDVYWVVSIKGDRYNVSRAFGSTELVGFFDTQSFNSPNVKVFRKHELPEELFVI